MKSFQRKKEELVELKEKLAKAKLVVFTSFARANEKGLNVSELRKLKQGLRENEAEYVVSKKTLTDRALKVAYPDQTMNAGTIAGSLGMVFAYGDAPAAAKALYGFARKNQALKLFNAIWEKQGLDEQGFLEFAKLPSREVLIGRIMGLMKYPPSMLANVLGEVAKTK